MSYFFLLYSGSIFAGATTYSVCEKNLATGSVKVLSDHASEAAGNRALNIARAS